MHLHCLHIFREPHMLLTSHSQSKQYIYRFFNDGGSDPQKTFWNHFSCLFHAFFWKSLPTVIGLIQLHYLPPVNICSLRKSQKTCSHSSSRSCKLEYKIRNDLLPWLHDYPPTSIILGHPLLPLTPGAFSLIQACSVATLVYTTGSRQQLYWFRMHPLNTPAAMYLHSYY